MLDNQDRVEQVTKDCEQLAAAFKDLKTAVDSLLDLSGRLEKLAAIRERRLNYDKNKNAH